MSNWISRWHRRQMHSRLYAFHTLELPAAEQEAVQRHLALCPACRAAIQRFADAGRALSAARSEPPVLTAERVDALFRRALEASQTRPRRTARPYGLALSLAAAGLGIVLWLTHLAYTARRPVMALHSPSNARAGQSAKSALPTAQTALLPSPRRSPIRERFKITKKGQETVTASLPAPRQRRRHHTTIWNTHSVVSALDALFARDLTLPNSPVNPPASGMRPQLPERFLPQPERAHLIVIMTGPSTPRLDVTVTTGPQTQPGFTRVASFAADAQGSGIWKQCTIRDDLQAETVSTTLYRFISGQPVACLALETIEPSNSPNNSEKNEKGDRP